ncbi:MAG: hypothetical protein ACHQ52_05160 [Candidatus Eisenbacteria bacterium]
MRHIRPIALGAVALALLADLLLLRGMPARPAGLDHDPVVVRESDRARVFGMLERRRLNVRHYDTLDALADSLRANPETFPDGSPVLGALYEQGFGTVDQPDDPAQWERHLDRLREWMDTRPQSNTARVALAEALIGRGWAARGGGWASSVSESQERRFETDLGDAMLLLSQCSPEARSDPQWYRAMMRALHGLGEEQDSAYRATFYEAIARFPDDPRFYVGMAGHLLPRWYGVPGQWEKFTGETVTVLPESLGVEIYARIVTDESRYTDTLFRDSPTLSWELTARGLDAWERHHPLSRHPRSARALLAWQAGRREDARRAFAAVGDTVDLDVWHSVGRYRTARHWADGGSGLTAASWGR